MGHLIEINLFLQFIVLCLGVVTGTYALVWQIRHVKDKNRP